MLQHFDLFIFFVYKKPSFFILNNLYEKNYTQFLLKKHYLERICLNFSTLNFILNP